MSNPSVRTSAFAHGESIPEKYTCEGEDVSPELTVDDELDADPGSPRPAVQDELDIALASTTRRSF